MVSVSPCRGSEPLGTLPFYPVKYPLENREQATNKIINAYESAPTLALKLSALRDVADLVTSQTGSKFLQKIIENASPQLVIHLVSQLSHRLPEVVMDNYGNYFCQKLLTSCSAEQRINLLDRLESKLLQICCDKRGTHTIQKFIDLANLEQEVSFF